MTNGRQDYDKDGAMAANRRIDHDLLAELAGRPELAAPPPRSLGREEFGDHFVDMLIAARRRPVTPTGPSSSPRQPPSPPRPWP
jgi:anhydro-N-acetylmuramic acid kinase